MDNSKTHYNFVYGYPILLFLFLLVFFRAGDVASREISVPMVMEEDLQRWLSLYQGPGSVRTTEEIQCLAQNIYFEARSESRQGQLAVGHVVMNRLAHKHYPNSVCEVVKQGGEKRRNRCQFSWWCDGRSDQPVDNTAWERSLKLATTIYWGQTNDPTDGALWYHADYVKPDWSSDLIFAKKIGHHLFYMSEDHRVYALNTIPTLQPDSNPINNSEQSKGFPRFKVSPSYAGMGTTFRFPVLQL